MERLHPGVYIQEISSGVRPIEGVSTSTTAFVGRTLKGNIDRPELVTSFAEFQSVYGDFISTPGTLTDQYLPAAALHYFNNGGKRLYVARVVTGSTTTAEQAAAANIVVRDRQPS